MHPIADLLLGQTEAARQLHLGTTCRVGIAIRGFASVKTLGCEARF
jgi:hypothetical protein